MAALDARSAHHQGDQEKDQEEDKEYFRDSSRRTGNSSKTKNAGNNGDE